MATYNTAMGVLPSPKTQLFGGNAGNATLEAPRASSSENIFLGANRPMAESTAMTPTAQQQLAPQATPPRPAPPTQTFAQMQQQGQARPAPGQFQLGQTFQPGAMAQNFLQRVSGRLSSMEEAPSVYDDPAFAQRRQAAMANLQAERQASQSKLEEEMASRGLFASSIAAGRMGDIAGQFARAQATMEADLLKEAMAQQQQREQFVTQQLGQLYGTVGEQELGGFRANIESVKAQREIELRAEELQQEAQFKGRELDLTQARDQATREYQSGQLSQAAAEMASRERQAANELAMRRQLQQEQQTFQRGESALERGLREMLQGRELTAEEQRQLRQFDFQRGESALERAQRETMQREQLTAAAQQNQLERDLRTKMQTTELSAAEKRQLMEIEANRAQQERQFGFQRGESALERNLRETMQTRDLTAAERRQLMEIEANKAQQERQFGFQRGESQLERDLRIAMQGTDIEARRAQMEAEQRFQAGQSQLERNLRETMQTRDLTAAEKRQLAEIEANKAQQERQFGFQRGESALDRALRERFGMAEATGVLYGADGKPVLDASGKPVQTLAGQQFGLSQRQFEASQQQAQTNFMIQLASALAPMDAAKRDEFLRNNPTIRNLLGMQSFGPVAGGTGAGIPRGTGGSGGGFGMDTGI